MKNYLEMFNFDSYRSSVTLPYLKLKSDFIDFLQNDSSRERSVTLTGPDLRGSDRGAIAPGPSQNRNRIHTFYWGLWVSKNQEKLVSIFTYKKREQQKKKYS
jgi:hypothetical protein